MVVVCFFSAPRFCDVLVLPCLVEIVTMTTQYLDVCLLLFFLCQYTWDVLYSMWLWLLITVYICWCERTDSLPVLYQNCYWIPGGYVCCVEAEAVRHILVSIKLTLEIEAALPLILSLSLWHTHKHTHAHSVVLLLRSICYSVEICSNSMGVSHSFCMGDWGLFVNAYYAKMLNYATLKEDASFH